MADAMDSKSSVRKDMRVRVPPPVLLTAKGLAAMSRESFCYKPDVLLPERRPLASLGIRRSWAATGYPPYSAAYSPCLSTIGNSTAIRVPLPGAFNGGFAPKQSGPFPDAGQAKLTFLDFFQLESDAPILDLDAKLVAMLHQFHLTFLLLLCLHAFLRASWAMRYAAFSKMGASRSNSTLLRYSIFGPFPAVLIHQMSDGCHNSLPHPE